MVTQVTIPVMDQTTESVTLAAWLVQQGATVRRGQVLCEIETEKATVEIEAPVEGTVLRVYIEKGTSIPPRTVVALLGDATDPIPELDPFYQTPRAKPAEVSAPAAPQTPPASAPAAGKVIASPRARKLAEENGIDLATLTPGGPEGRIVEDDVKAAIRARTASGGSTDGDKRPATAGERSAHAKAQRVTQSWQTIPHFYMSVTADLSALLAAKARAGKTAPGGTPETYTDYFVVALARTLTGHPHFNGYWQNDSASPSAEIRIGIVVQTERGLLIPALRDVRNRSVADIAVERAQIVQQALAGKLGGDALAEPTFTLSNVGAGHIDSFTAIISPPQLAILSVGSVLKRAVVAGDALTVRPTATFTLGADHRALDGKQSAAFLEDLKQNLETL